MEKASIIFGENRDLAEDKNSWITVPMNYNYYEFMKDFSDAVQIPLYYFGLDKASENFPVGGMHVQLPCAYPVICEDSEELKESISQDAWEALQGNFESDRLYSNFSSGGLIQTRQNGASPVITDEPEDSI